MYNTIFKLLIEAKSKGSNDEISGALIQSFKEIKNYAEDAGKYNEFSEFIEDNNMLFQTRKNTSTPSDVEITVESTGLINQLFDLVNVENHENYVQDLYDSIWNLYSRYSEGIISLNDEKEKVINSSSVLMDIIPR